MKQFPDGRIAEIIPLTFGRARIVVSSLEDSLIGYYSDGF